MAMILPLQIERQYGASLDADYSFDTLTELKNYALTSALAYPGQILYCKETDILYKVNSNKTDVNEIGGTDIGAYEIEQWETFYSALNIDATTTT